MFGFIWDRTGSEGNVFSIQKSSFIFYKIRKVSWSANGLFKFAKKGPAPRRSLFISQDEARTLNECVSNGMMEIF